MFSPCVNTSELSSRKKHQVNLFINGLILSTSMLAIALLFAWIFYKKNTPILALTVIGVFTCADIVLLVFMYRKWIAIRNGQAVQPGELIEFV